MLFLIASQGMTDEQARDLALEQHCVGYYMEVPPVWSDMAQTENWSYPCCVSVNDEGTPTYVPLT